MKNQNDENEEIEFILKVLDFNEMIDDWEKILKASEEERRNVELNRKNRSFNLRKRKSINRKSTQAFIEKFSIWEKQANN